MVRRSASAPRVETCRKRSNRDLRESVSWQRALDPRSPSPWGDCRWGEIPEVWCYRLPEPRRLSPPRGDDLDQHGCFHFLASAASDDDGAFLPFDSHSAHDRLALHG